MEPKCHKNSEAGLDTSILAATERILFMQEFDRKFGCSCQELRDIIFKTVQMWGGEGRGGEGRGQVAQKSTNERQQFDSLRTHRGIDPLECVRAASRRPCGNVTTSR